MSAALKAVAILHVSHELSQWHLLPKPQDTYMLACVKFWEETVPHRNKRILEINELLELHKDKIFPLPLNEGKPGSRGLRRIYKRKVCSFLYRLNLLELEYYSFHIMVFLFSKSILFTYLT